MSNHSQASHDQLVVAVDLDGVIAISDPLIRQIIHRLSGVAIAPDEMRDYAYSIAMEARGIDPRVAREIEVEALRIFNDEECRHIELVPGAAEGLSRLLDLGLKVVIATSRPYSSEQTTKLWLKDIGLPCQEVVFLQEKFRNASEWALLVEDAPHHARAVSEVGVPVCLLDYPWNRAIDPHPLIHRVKDWNEIVSFVLSFTNRVRR